MEVSKLPFSPVRVVGSYMVFLSGQVGLKSGQLVSGGIKKETAQAIANVGELLKEYNLSLKQVVDVMVFLVNQDDYLPFNEIYAQLFERPYPARTCVTVKSLPLGARMELKVIATMPI